MKILSLPENHADQVRWLESALMGPDFGRVVAELSAVFGNESIDLTDAEQQSIGELGLSELTPDRFKQLLKSPTTLVKLQQDVVEFGGDYWNSIAPSESQTIIERAWPVKSPTANTDRGSARSWGANIAWAGMGSLATAAALMVMLSGKNDPLNQPVAVAVNPTPEDPVTGARPVETIIESGTWGFEKFANSNLVNAADVDRSDYFENIASAAEAWSNKRPATPAALAKRLGEFRMGCSAILLANHPLPPEDKKWLKDRCQQWAAAIENHLAELEGGMSVQEVTTRVDATATKIAAAIKGRSATS